MDNKDIILKQIKESIAVKEAILNNQSLLEQIHLAANLVTTTYKNGGKTLLAGNGGSAADAQHIAGEFVSRFYFDRPGLPSIALSTDTSIITAIGNDYGYDKLFERQVDAHGNKGDIFIGISTSGNSENVVKGLLAAKKKGLHTISLTGETGGKLADISDICLKVPSKETPRIQESHILIGHIICCLVEEDIFGNLK